MKKSFLLPVEQCRYDYVMNVRRGSGVEGLKVTGEGGRMGLDIVYMLRFTYSCFDVSDTEWARTMVT